MRVLLPPSEAKHPGGAGRPLGRRTRDRDLDRAADPLLQALVALVPAADAAERLLLPDSVAAAALAANGRVWQSPTLPALERYAGVVYDGLAAADLSAAARRLAGRSVLIFSGLFGVLRGNDPVPEYRVPAKATLPGVGVASSYWRARLPELLPPLLDRGPILDLRSTDYAGMWQPARDALRPTLISVRILSATPSGRLAVVSYNSKLAKGRLAAAVLERAAAGRPVRDADDVAGVWQELGGSRVGAGTTGRAGRIAVELIE